MTQSATANVSLDDVLLRMPATLRQAMQQISRNALGIVFLVDDDRRLLGSLSDGDARRALLAGATLDDVIAEGAPYFKRTPQFLPFKCDIVEIWRLLDQDLRCIPLVDAEHHVVDFSTRVRIRQFPVHEPDIGDQEISNVLDCMTTGWVSSQGRFIPMFEEDFSKYLGGGHAVAVSNGTVALQLGLSALGIGEGDEVLVPDFTFGASVNAIIHANATPVLVDVDRETWTIDLASMERAITPRTKAIMPVHIYGQPARMDEILEIARIHGLKIVEDCAEILGGIYKGRKVGLDGDCSCFSFFANKVITTGEGGMVVFRDRAAARHARTLRDHGMVPGKRYWHDYAGFNFRMTNLQAAIGVAQLERIDEFLQRRRALFEIYDSVFAGDSRIELLPHNDWSEKSFWLYTVLLNDAGEDARDALITRIARRGVDARPGFYPMHAMKPYKEFSRGDYPVSTYLAANSINLPSSPGLSKTEIRHIADVFLEEMGR